MPPVGDYLWPLFVQMSNARSSNGFSPNPLGWRDLADWQRLTGYRLSAWERDTLLAIDRVYLADGAERMSKRAEKKRP